MTQETTVDSTVTSDSPTTMETPNEVVPKSELEHALGDLNKHKSRARDLEDEVKKLREANLKSSNDWKQIAENRENELNEYKSKYENLSTGVVIDKKLTQVREEALKAGILNESLKDLDMLNWDDVQIETTSTGRINVLGADKAIAKLKMLRPHWFNKAGAPKVNTGSPTVTTSPTDKVEYKQLQDAEIAAKKTGNYDTYKELLLKYKQQTSNH